ncbi:MAG: aminotransferase class IV [Leptolyngbya sp. SIO1E4]|nr:aminotransferase class IV [Leptolyngbya sp. SIO1E4]
MSSVSQPPCYWYDGQLFSESTLSLPIQEPGLLYGATVFTTVRVYEKALSHPWTAWPAHIDRMTQSLQAFAWPLPDWGQIRQGAEGLAQRYPILRVTVFSDGRSLILGRSLPTNLTTLQAEGVTAWVADSPDYSRPLPGHKTGNYLSCWLARQVAQRVGAQEAILINEQGHWLETSTGNLWGWANGAWWTPPLATRILPGILRSRLVQGLQAQGHTVMRIPWTPEQVTQFTCLAYTNSVVEVIPIRSVLRGAASVNYNPDHGKLRYLDTAWRSAG